MGIDKNPYNLYEDEELFEEATKACKVAEKQITKILASLSVKYRSTGIDDTDAGIDIILWKMRNRF